LYGKSVSDPVNLTSKILMETDNAYLQNLEDRRSGTPFRASTVKSATRGEITNILAKLEHVVQAQSGRSPHGRNDKSERERKHVNWRSKTISQACSSMDFSKLRKEMIDNIRLHGCRRRCRYAASMAIHKRGSQNKVHCKECASLFKSHCQS
jgi:hypothetical protein